MIQSGSISGPCLKKRFKQPYSWCRNNYYKGTLNSPLRLGTPIFVIKKKNGSWRLLQDLRAVNKTMVPMGALQPGLPSPIAIPRDFYKIVIDIKDCFFSIPLHPEDCARFAFSIPVINHVGPNPRFQWHMLPQGMANSPTLCQRYVAQTIDPIRLRFPLASSIT